ncbi:MAG: radical SAM protein [Promethearchaeota archaeon]
MKKRNEFYPYTIIWDFTKKCNLRCVYCYNDDTAGGKTLPLEKVKFGETPPSFQPDLTTEQIRNRLIPQFKEMKLRSLCLSGGEPFTRWKDIIDLAPDFTDIGLEEFLIATNGTLMTKQKIKELKHAYRDVPALFLSIPIDSLDPERVAMLRPPLDNVLDRCKKAIDLALKEGFIVTIETVINRENIDEMETLIRLSKKKGASCFSEIYPMFAEGRAKERNDLLLTVEQLQQFDRITLREYGNRVTWDAMPFIPEKEYWETIKDDAREAQITEGCIAAREYLQIDHAGNVYPCSFLRIFCGNILETTLKEIWENNEMFVRFRNRDVGGKCGTCKHKMECGGCRARAFTETGDPYGGVESCEGGPNGHPLEHEFTEKLKKVYNHQKRLVKALEVTRKLHLLPLLRKLGVKGV